jgi:hypothetical protein
MKQNTKMRKLPIAMAAVLAFLAIGTVENAKARPLDNGGRHGGHHYHHRHYGKYGWYGYGYHPYKYHPRPLSSYYRYR